MSEVIGYLVARGGRLILLFVFIVLLLLAADRLRGEWQDISQARARLIQSEMNIEEKQIQRENRRTKLEEEEHMRDAELAGMHSAIRNRMQELAALIEDAKEGHLSSEKKYIGLREQAIDVGNEILRVEERLRWLREAFVGRVVSWIFSKRISYEIEQLESDLHQLTNSLEDYKRLQDDALAAWQRSPYPDLYAEHQQLKGRLEVLGLPESPEIEQLRMDIDRLSGEIDILQQEVDRDRQKIEEDPREQAIAIIKAKFFPAGLILAGIIAMPKLIKILLYWGLAPLAGQLPSIRILPKSTTEQVPQIITSGVSIKVPVTPSQELLVNTDFMQTTSKEALKRTKWFLNAKLPLSSIASGMYFLTRIVPDDISGTIVTVSSRSDPFSEVSLVDLPEGASIVVQPRSLAGIVKPVAQPALITRHWRITSLHAWLTFQLRYLVFHGPCQLIFKGCRGVKCETPDEAKPRLINQAATIGFSATLGYQTLRNETFLPYFFGKEDLFNDVFTGTEGRFLYEELPNRGRRGGIGGRGLEGVIDAFLKAFGI